MTVCSVHDPQPAIGTCARCGRFVCAECTTLCPACRARRDREVIAPPQWMVTAIAVLLAIQALNTCGLLLVRTLAPTVDGRQLMIEEIVTLIVGAWFITFAGQGLLAVCFLAWYATLLDWARRRGLTRASGLAVAAWFVPGVNVVHPYRTLRRLADALQIAPPLKAWWVALWLSAALFVGWVAAGGSQHDVLAVLASSANVVAAILCGFVVRGFTAATRA